MLPGQRFSHTTAAHLHGMWLPSGFVETAVHVVSTGGRRAPRRAGVIGHRDDVISRSVLVAGVAASHPVQAWIECGELLPPRDLVVMADGLLRRRDPLAALAELATAVERRPHHRGIVALRAALLRARPGADSAMESLLRQWVVDAGFPEPHVNCPIRDSAGRLIALGDLVWPEQRIILEYEGDRHRTDKRQFSTDIDRIGELHALGWRVIRIDAALFRRRSVLLERIRSAWRQTGAPPLEVTSPGRAAVEVTKTW